jgi:iron complex transport system ATP-binding protein
MRYGNAEVLRGVTITFDTGEFATIAGPNGAGKSTVLGIMAGLRSHYLGSCRLKGREISRWPRRDFARLVSTVPQHVRIEFPFTAEQVVLMGRAPFAGSLFESDEDDEHVRQAMELTGTAEFRERDFRSLSGGEQQRVILAAALAQSPRVLLLDEPTAYLDIEHQISLYRLLSDLCRQGVLVVAVTHDLNLAAAHASRIVLLRGGALAADGAPEAVLTPALLHDVFRVEARVCNGPGGKPWIQYAS